MSRSIKRSSRDAIAAVVEALGDEPVDAEEVRATVARLGTDVRAMALGLRAKIAAADEADRRKKRVEDARTAYAAELERLERRRQEPRRPRDEQVTILQALLARAPGGNVAIHFHHYESATDDELAELIRSLRHLIGEDDSEG